MQGEHKNPFIYISTYCNNIYQELLTFVFDFRKTSVQKPLTLNNTSGLFNHHMRRVIQRGEALWKEEKQEGTPNFFVHFVVLVGFEKKKSGTKDEQLNKKTDKIHQKIDWKTKKLQLMWFMLTLWTTALRSVFNTSFIFSSCAFTSGS